MTAKLFPMDGYADTCIGFERTEHGADTLTEDGLCEACTRLLHDVVTAGWQPLPEPCRNCKGHQHGAKYYDCMCCYGD